MKLLKESLRTASISSKDQIMLWAAFTTAFFGFLRASEFCSTAQGSFDPASTLMTRDITIRESQISINIKTSKVDPFRVDQEITLAPSGTSICPVRALQKHLPNCTSQNMPVCTFEDGGFLTRQLLSSTLQNLLSSSTEKSTFTSHSFRIGAATSAAAAGLPDWLIKTLGRWSSDCYQRYIRTPKYLICSVPRILANTSVGVHQK